MSAVAELADALCRRYADRITGELTLPGSPADLRALPDDLDPRLQRALRSLGYQGLYSHQLEAWQALRRRSHTVIVTPTASGKTLCYNLPVAQSVLERRAKSLYLFPTKALSQDQVAAIQDLNRAGELGIRAFTFDGDTPGDARRAVRTKGDIVVTNPDMLHQGVLPHHTKWAQFFEQLETIVVDEMHTYRGVFGSHVANVFRRLRRICRFYGSEPTFVFCSATIANPDELASLLANAPVTTIDQCGAPRGERRVLFWNPPVVNPELGIRASARSQTTRLARLALRAGLKCILFARSRLAVEVLTKYLKDVFDHDPRKPARVRAYRGGYLPTERRTTERALRAGEIDCVVSTSALELGVDIGSLDVCLLNGYPGTIAGTWQRLGRAGRRHRTSLGVMVASSLPLDQYVVRHPEFFFGASPESARIAPDHTLLLFEHVRCAAFELPFQGSDFDGQDVGDLLDYLAEQGVVHREANQWCWIEDAYPAGQVNLRSVADGNFVVVDRSDGGRNIIAEVDYTAAAVTLYEGAIYMVQSTPWQVEKLDWEGRKAYVRRTHVDYYTDAIDYTKLKILESFASTSCGAGNADHGEVHVVRRVTGYKKIRYYTHENIGYGPVDLPDQEMHTTSAWWRLGPQVIDARFADRSTAMSGCLGAITAMRTVACLRVMCEQENLGSAVGNGDTSTAPDEWSQGVFEPTLFLYDNHPGGLGLSAGLHEAASTIVADAAELIERCACPGGCPACIGPVLAAEEHRGETPKAAAIAVLELLTQREPVLAATA